MEGRSNPHPGVKIWKIVKTEEDTTVVIARVRGRPITVSGVPVPMHDEIVRALADIASLPRIDFNHLNSFSPFGISWE